ncbi:MAG: hypothetical protein PHY09_06425 [Desulfuromonadaceae bacterium]|nr:hypothetical protein [Desulfuromonadaceae bacterium]MDD5104081.1 hypothetical protein [Desulfuromonadaceae bacterium]
MNRVLSFYYDGALVQAVTVRIVDGLALVEDARSFPFEELTGYLSICQEKSCVVCSNPQQFNQDIIHLPPAAAKHYEKLVRGEVLRLHPELTAFSFMYHIIGDSMIDTKPFNKIAVFSYADAFLADFMSELNTAEMATSAIYPAPYVIQKLALSTCSADPDQPCIVIASLQGEKFFLVSENGELEFVRKIPSLYDSLLPDDTNNINMTVDYCFQSLRLRPIEAVMLNQPKFSLDLSHLVSIPFRAALPPELTDLPAYIVQEYLAPVAAALHAVTSPRTGNILPSGYTRDAVHKKIFAGATLFMALLSLVAALLFVKEFMAVSRLKSSISGIKTELRDSAQELAAFRALEKDVGQFKQPLELINKHNASANPATALAALHLPVSEDYQIKSVSVQNGVGWTNIRIEGTLNGSGYSNTQALYEKFVAQVAQLPGLTAVSGNVDVKLKSVNIQARYIDKGPKSK